MSVWAFGGNRFDISRYSSLKAFPASSGCSSILAEKWNLCELTEREEFVWLRVWSKGNSSPNGARVNFAKLLLKFWSFFPRWSHLPPFYGRWVSLQKHWYFLAGVHVRIYLVNCLSLLWEGIRINKRFHVISTWIQVVLLWGINLFDHPPLTQDVNWTYIRRSEDVLDIFWTSYVHSIYVLCLRGLLNLLWSSIFPRWQVLLRKSCSLRLEKKSKASTEQWHRVKKVIKELP